MHTNTLEQLRAAQKRWADTPEKLMLCLVDMIAANPHGVIDPRLWEQLLAYVPPGLRKRPVAFRYKNDIDQWVYTENEAETQHALDTGHNCQGLYVRDGQP